MTDVVSKKTRSRMMSNIRARNTRPEIAVRKFLFSKGFRFRLHRRDLPGSPDIVLPKYKLAVFVHGCFWHRHKGCRFAYTPKTRTAFWKAKFESNVARDKRAIRMLKHLGWNIATVWECQVKAHKLEFLLDTLKVIR
jgi:DNA mismatch endonuclease, patch repair protein